MAFKFEAMWGLLATIFLLAPAVSLAASLQVSPVGVEVAAPGVAATLTLRNEGDHPLDAQIRVFRWTQVDGKEQLLPSEDVVASPPAASLKPKTAYTVRLVRVAKGVVSGEEAYRLIVDELPDAARPQGTAVNIVLRYSIPVFFKPAQPPESKVTWAIQPRNGRFYVVAANTGERHLRVSDLRVKDAKGTIASFGNGLNGYVLGGSTMRWELPRGTRRLSIGAVVEISASGDAGAINAKALIVKAP